MNQPEKAQASLAFRGVTKSYRTHFWQKPVVSLRDLSLELQPGETLGLLGPNGAGKTTTIKLALGLLFPDGGEVWLNGLPAAHPGSRRGVGFLPENPYFPEDLTGRELVEFAARMHGLSASLGRRQAAAWLERVGLAEVADRKLRKYSKGMVQRAGMARALCASPRLLILDEPMSGLDPLGRREFRDLILELRGQGVAVLFSSHVLADAEMLCDRVAILKNGRLLAVRELGSLQRERGLRGWEVESEGGGAPKGAELVARRGEICLWRFSRGWEAEQVLEAVRAAGGRPQRLTPQRESLEDLFLSALAAEEEGAR